MISYLVPDTNNRFVRMGYKSCKQLQTVESNDPIKVVPADEVRFYFVVNDGAIRVEVHPTSEATELRETSLQYAKLEYYKGIPEYAPMLEAYERRDTEPTSAVWDCFIQQHVNTGETHIRERKDLIYSAQWKTFLDADTVWGHRVETWFHNFALEAKPEGPLGLSPSDSLVVARWHEHIRAKIEMVLQSRLWDYQKQDIEDILFRMMTSSRHTIYMRKFNTHRLSCHRLGETNFRLEGRYLLGTTESGLTLNIKLPVKQIELILDTLGMK